MSSADYAIHCRTADCGAKRWTQVIQTIFQINPHDSNTQAWIREEFVPWETQRGFIDEQGGAVIYYDSLTCECGGWNGLRDHVERYTGYRNISADDFLDEFGKSSCKISIDDMLLLL